MGDPIDDMSPEEKVLLERLFFDGSTLREIAEDQGLSLATVQQRVDSLLTKLGRNPD
jgi:DNA-binding NarL/FixJ family response regulator